MFGHRPIVTPCIKVCFVDPDSGLCLGCFRKTEEIARWMAYTDDERDAIMAALPNRRELIAPEKLG